MMTRVALVLGILALAIPVSGCVYSHAGPGLIFMDVKGPLGPSDGSPGGRTGEACAQNILGIVASGDATIDTAKAKGRINNAKTIEYHSTNILGFGKFCTVVDD